MADKAARKPTDRLADEALAQLTRVLKVVRSLVGESFFLGWLEHQMSASRASLQAQLQDAGLGQHTSLLSKSVLGADDFVSAEGDAWAGFYRGELERISRLKGSEMQGAAAMAMQALKSSIDPETLTITHGAAHQAEAGATH